METMTFVVPCLFGLEGLAAEELRRLGMEQVQAENGRVLFQGGQEAMAMAQPVAADWGAGAFAPGEGASAEL